VQLVSTDFSCSIEVDVGGYQTVPTHSTVLVDQGCPTLLIQVKGKLPEEVRPWYRDYSLGSFRPYLELKMESGLVRVVKLMDGKESVQIAANNGNINFSKNRGNKEEDNNKKLASLQEALDFTVAGSTLEVPFGHYFESLNITKPVRLVGNGKSIIFGSIQVYSHDVVLDGLLVFSLEPLKPSVEVHFASGVTIHNCRLEQGSYVHSDVHAKETVAIVSAHSSRVAVVNSQVVGFGIGIELRNCTECVIQSNWIQSCWVAISLVHSGDVLIKRNLFRENEVISGTSGAMVLNILMGSNIFQDNVWLMSNQEGPQSMGRYHRRALDKLLGFDSTAVVTGSCMDKNGTEISCATSRAGL